MSDLNSFLEMLENSASIEECWQGVAAELYRRGYEGVRYWIESGTGRKSRNHEIDLTYTKQFWEKLRLFPNVRQHCRTSIVPAILPLSQDNSLYVFCVPTRGGAIGAKGGFAVALDRDQAENLAASKTQVTMLALVAFSAHNRIVEHFATRPFDRFRVTNRQLEVLKLRASGLQNDEIAFELGISVGGVSYHLTELKRRFGLHSSREILSFAIRKNLLSP